jgi:RNA polymerase sigma factor (sigma-70 family)
MSTNKKCYFKPIKIKFSYLMSIDTISVTTLEESAYFSPVSLNRCEKLNKNSLKNCLTDEAILTGLKMQDLPVIKYIYKQFYQQIRNLIRSNSGTEMDAEDIFQDALVIIYQKISSENLKLVCAFSTYLHSICRHLWLQKLKKHEFRQEYKEVVNLDECQYNYTLGEQIEENEKYNLFRQHFLRLSPDDQMVLKLFMRKISLKEIAQIMGYKSVEYAKVRKYICKEKLKNSILNDPQFREIYENEFLSPVLSC